MRAGVSPYLNVIRLSSNAGRAVLLFTLSATIWLTANSAQGSEYTGTSETNPSDWNDPENWAEGVPPGPNDSVFIDGYNLIAPDFSTFASLQLSGGAQLSAAGLTIEGTLQISGPGTALHLGDLNAESISVFDSAFLSATSIVATDLSVTDDASIRITDLLDLEGELAITNPSSLCSLGYVANVVNIDLTDAQVSVTGCYTNGDIALNSATLTAYDDASVGGEMTLSVSSGFSSSHDVIVAGGISVETNSSFSGGNTSATDVAVIDSVFGALSLDVSNNLTISNDDAISPRRVYNISEVTGTAHTTITNAEINNDGVMSIGTSTVSKSKIDGALVVAGDLTATDSEFDGGQNVQTGTVHSKNSIFKGGPLIASGVSVERDLNEFHSPVMLSGGTFGVTVGEAILYSPVTNNSVYDASYSIASGSTLLFQGACHISSESSVKGSGLVVFQNNSNIIDGEYNVNGETDIWSAVSVTLNTDAVFGTLVLQGTINSANRGFTITVIDELTCGLNINDFAGITNLDMEISDGYCEINCPTNFVGSNLTLGASVRTTWANGRISFTGNSATSLATLTNNGSIDIQCNQPLAGNSFSSLVNSGSVAKAQSGTTNFFIFMDNRNTMSVGSSGTFTFNNGGSATGSFATSNNSSIQFIGASVYTLDDGASFPGSGTVLVTNSSQLVINGSVSAAGILDVGTAGITGGTISGTASGNSKLTMNGTLNLLEGALGSTSSSSLSVVTANVLNIQTSGGLAFNNCSLTNKGVANWISGNINGSTPATLLNDSGGTLNVKTLGASLNNSSATLRNRGVLTMSLSAATLTVPKLVQSGEIDLIIGPTAGSTTSFDKIVVTGDATLGGTLKLTPNGYTQRTADTFTVLNGHTISGKFASINNGALAFRATYALTGSPQSLTLGFNRPPVIGSPNPVVITTSENTPVSYAIQATDSDGDALTYSVVTQPTNGMVSFAGNILTYTPNTDSYNDISSTEDPDPQPDSLQYQVSDGANPVTSTVNATVHFVNQPPMFNLGTVSPAISNNEPIVISNFATNIFRGPDSEPPQMLTFTAIPDDGTLFEQPPVISPSGDLSFKPKPGVFGSTSITVTLKDDGGTSNGGNDTSPAQFFNITIHAIPVVFPGEYDAVENQQLFIDADSGVLQGGDPVEGTFFSAELITDALFGTVTLDPSGSFVYTPNDNYFSPPNTPDQFTFVAANEYEETSEITVTINVHFVNQPPSFVGGLDQVVSDDDDPISVLWATGISQGPSNEPMQQVNFLVNVDNYELFEVAPAIDSSGNLSFTPMLGTFGQAIVTVQAQDSGGTDFGGIDKSDPLTFTITVHATPVAVPDTYTVYENQPLVLSVMDNDVDIEGAGMFPDTSPELKKPEHGTIAFNTNGTITYTPNPGYVSPQDSTDTFEYFESGPLKNSEPTTVTLTIVAINQAPSFTQGGDRNVDLNPNVVTFTQWATNISAGQGEQAQLIQFLVINNTNSAIFDPAGLPAISPDGTLTFTLTPNATGSSQITIVLKDNGGTDNGGVDTSAPQTFTISINEMKDPEVSAGNLYVTRLEAVGPDFTPNSFPQAIVVMQPRQGTVYDPLIQIDYQEVNGMPSAPTMLYGTVGDLDSNNKRVSNIWHFTAIPAPDEAHTVVWNVGTGIILDGGSTTDGVIRVQFPVGRHFPKLTTLSTDGSATVLGTAEIHSIAIENNETETVDSNTDTTAAPPVNFTPEGSPFGLNAENGGSIPVDASIFVTGAPGTRVSLDGYPQNEYRISSQILVDTPDLAQVATVGSNTTSMYLQSYGSLGTATLNVQGQALIESLDSDLSWSLDDNDPMPVTATWQTADQEGFGIYQLEIVEISPDGSTTPMQDVTISAPSPSVNLSSANVTIDPPSGDGKINGHLSLVGVIKSGVCDINPNGTISNVLVFKNDETKPVAQIPLSVTKGSSSNLYQQYPYTGILNQSIDLPDLHAGLNVFTIAATDNIYFDTGVAEISFVVAPILPDGTAIASRADDDPIVWIFGVAATVISYVSDSSDFHPLSIHVTGPQTLIENHNFKVPTLAGQRSLVKHTDGNFYVAAANGIVPEVALTLKRLKSNLPAPIATGVQMVADDAAYKTGALAGFLDGGVSLVSGTVELAMWQAELPFEPYVLLAERQFDPKAFQQHIARYKANTKTFLNVVALMWQLDQAGPQARMDILRALISHDPYVIGGLSEKYISVLKLGFSIFLTAVEQYATLSPYERGKIEGRISFEILLLLGGEVTEAANIEKLTEIELLARFIDDAEAKNLFDADFIASLTAKLQELKNLPCCFVAGTAVQTIQGICPVENIRVGDWVLSRDERSGRQEYRQVLHTFITHPHSLRHIKYNNGFSELVCTGTHPFWENIKRKFIPASELVAGSSLLLSDGHATTVTSNMFEMAGDGQHFTTYNFEVDGFHTYFAGDCGVWVHNSGLNCEQIAEVYSRIEQIDSTMVGKSPWAKFQTTMKFVEVNGEVASGKLIAKAIKCFTDESYAEAVASGYQTTVPSYTELNNFLTGRKGFVLGSRSDIQIHHVIPKYLQRMLGIAEADLDTCPGLALLLDDHVGPGSIHSFIDAEGIGRLPSGAPPYEKGKILLGLNDAYNNAGLSDVWAVAKEWLRLKGIQ